MNDFARSVIYNPLQGPRAARYYLAMLTRRRFLTLISTAVATISSQAAVFAQKKGAAPKSAEVTLAISGMT
jgi:hypothetical protein